MLVALDSNVFIAFLSHDDKFYKPALDIIKRIDSGKTQAVCSAIVYGEVVYTAKRENAIHEVGEFFDRLTHCVDMPADKKVCVEAAKLRVRYPTLKLPDAIHLATAVLTKADVFITADKRLAKIAANGIKTIMLGAQITD